MKILMFITITFLSGCVAPDPGGHSGSNGNQCKRVQSSCIGGVYDEWVQKNGDISCSCNGKLNIPTRRY